MAEAQKEHYMVEAQQMQHLAGLLRNFDKSKTALAGIKVNENTNSAALNSSFNAKKAKYEEDFKKLSGFATTHVSLLADLAKTSIKYPTDKDNLALEKMSKLSKMNINLNLEFNLRYAPPGTELDIGTFQICANSGGKMVPLLYFYNGGPEASEKTAYLVASPSKGMYASQKEITENTVPVRKFVPKIEGY